MFNTVKKLLATFSRNREPFGHSQASSRSHAQSVLPDGSEVAKQGQLVQVLMRNLMRKSGIPLGWVECQFQVINSRTRGQGIFVRLVVKHWDERLMKHAFAFQKTLLTNIVEFEPKASTWLQGISWQLEVASSCPVTELPSGQFWQAAPAIDPFEIIPMPASAMPVAQPPRMPQSLATPALAGAAAASAIPLLDELEPLPPLAVAAVLPENDTTEDLEKLFAIRDKELESMAINSLLPVGYEKTEPAPL